MSLSPQWLDELRARVTLSAVIGRTTRLTKAGHEFKACCPFHNEKSPSFTVNDQKGFYHCFGCGAHGDAIRWMIDQRGLAFMDAVKELAAEAGMEVPAADPRAAKIAERQSGLHDVMAAAQEWYRAQLDSPAGAKAREYLGSRRFDAHTMERFGFGFAPAGRQALKAALGQFDEAMLIDAGMRIAVDDKEPYDRFRDRLTMPIQDARGRVIGFAARILDAEKKDAPKYLNSPDTPLFDKGRTLFNLHRAGPASRQTGRIVVVEGQMDVVALAAAGIDEAVAPMGTALTERQIEMLWRLVEAPILCFDGDSAGQRAAMRAITRTLPLLRPAHTLRICRLPTGLDPDDLIRQQGVAALEQILGGARSLVETLWENERDAQPLSTPEDKAGLKARLMAHVETIADPDIKALYRRELSERFSEFAFPPRQAQAPRSGPALRGQRFTREPQIAPPAPETARRLQQAVGQGRKDGLAAAVIAGLIRYPQAISRHADALSRAQLSDAGLARILDALLDHFDHGQPLESQAIDTTLSNKGLSVPTEHSLSGIPYPFVRPSADPQASQVALDSAVVMLVEGPELEAALAAATERFDFEEQTRLRARKQELEERLKAQNRT